ncbi:MAG: family transcriptional regulator, regulator of sulfur utilization [Clostridiales bacterium]|nr:family transcriptional regulator, regulator of sulfur utilization [Clostridiales bacterium]
MEINQIVADNLKRLRIERNLSLGQLAALCGVSKVMLFHIEKGTTNPTVNTMWKIANGLKVPYTVLLEFYQPEAQVVTKQSAGMQLDEGDHYRLYCYYPNTPNRNFEWFQIELDPGEMHESIGHTSKTEEYIMVLSGTLELTLNGEVYRLEPEESIKFDASAPHSYLALGTELLKATIVNYYPA